MEYTLAAGAKFNQNISLSNWTTLLIDFHEEIHLIYKKFSKGHKSSIKKAQITRINTVYLTF